VIFKVFINKKTMRGYFGLGQLSATEKSDILDQHKSIYNGYQTMQPQVSNTQPLTVYDFAGDKEGLVVNNKGEVKKYTNMGINEQVDTKEVCDDCGAMIMDGVCRECNYGHMEESEHYEGEMCEQCGGTMKENVCEQCCSGTMEEEVGHLDDIYNVKDLNLKNGDFDYVEGGGNDYGTFEGMYKKLYKESDDDYMDYESSYTEDDMEDPDNEDDGFEDINSSEVTDGEVYEIDIKDLIKGKKYRYKTPASEDDIEYGDEHQYPEGESMYGFKGKGGSGYALGKKGVEDFVSSLDDDSELYEQGGNVDDMDVDDVDSAYNFVSNGPGDVYPVNELDEDDMYGYEPEKEYETMESAWAEDDLEEGYSDWDIDNEFEIKNDIDLPRGHKHLKKGDKIKLTKKWKNANRGIHGDIFGSDKSEDDYGLDRDDIERMSRYEFDEQTDISGAQGIYGDMKRAYDFDSDGPGKGGPYQEFSYESEIDEEIDEELRESFIVQKNKIQEMFNRFKKYN